MYNNEQQLQRYQQVLSNQSNPVQTAGFGGLASMGFGGLSMMGLGGLPAQPQQGRGIISGFFEGIRQAQALSFAQNQTAMIEEQSAQIATIIEMVIMVATAADRLADIQGDYRHNEVMRVLEQKAGEAAILKAVAEAGAIKASIGKTDAESEEIKAIAARILAEAESIKVGAGLTLIDIEQAKLKLNLTQEEIVRMRHENGARDIENQLARLEMEIKTRSYQQNFAVR